MSTASFRSADSLDRWSLVNAVGMLGAAAAAMWGQSPWPVLWGGGGLLVGVAVVHWGQGGDRPSFGLADLVTAGRAALLFLLPVAAAAGSGILIGLGLLILVADGVDGWVARRREHASAFGAVLDKETDALFLLVLCVLAAVRGRVGDWILGAGLLRYGFVLLLFLLPPLQTTEERSALARYIFVGMVLAVLTVFLPYPALYRPVVIGATAALVGSFARSLWRIVPRDQPFGDS